ncbi:hypothetical protein HYH02_000615 [Chlamydomonas schloesseri]|uniref:SHSP domain-containing protein n=1 Tax=Chlamydomonas schloesseri TaxID=2026947 RepID=A0A835WW02_9CHLO|nr:hypothetical protein HYH02_000615 [Chlamydomonas schloesseri]|eukprot:KAG2454780.1 hypothetical protein HYH02_000615 [Chlamydomonas schloesseri]
MSLNHALRRSAAQLLARAATGAAPEMLGPVRTFSRSAGDLALSPFRGCSPSTRSLSPFFPPSSLGSLSRAMDELVQMDRHLSAELANFFGGDSPLAHSSPFFRDSPFRSAIHKAVSVSRPAQFRAFEDRYELQADMPGVAESDLNIELDAEEGLLTISGARRDEAAAATLAAAGSGPASAAAAASQPPQAAAGAPEAPAAAAAGEAAAAAAPAAEAAATAEAGGADDVSSGGRGGGGGSVWTFRGTWRLPEDVEADGVTAALDRGVLRVTLPRRQAPEKPQPRRIKISGGGGAAN